MCCELHHFTEHLLSSSISGAGNLTNTVYFAPDPVAQSVECPLRRTGGHGFDQGPRHIKVIKMVLIAPWHLRGRARTGQPSAMIM